MEPKTAPGRIGSLVAIAALIGAAFGAIGYFVQSPDGDLVRVTRDVRTHDQVVTWPNHSAIQRAAAGYINDPVAVAAIREKLPNPDSLVSVEAQALGDPASIEVTATAADEPTAQAAAAAAVDEMIRRSLEERRVPKEALVESLRANLASAEAERDDLAAAGEGRPVGQLEAAAGAVSVLRVDLARAAAELDALVAPLVAVGPQPVERDSPTQGAMAIALAAFLVSLLGLSVFGPKADSPEQDPQAIDLRKTLESETTELETEQIELAHAHSD